MRVTGAYVLYFEIGESCVVEAGALGDVGFRPGVYAYVGSAMRGLCQRLGRHFSRKKALRWHIDYITPYARTMWATKVPSRKPVECFIARHLISNATKKRVVKGFGASDCSCPSHLVYLGESSIRRTRSCGT